MKKYLIIFLFFLIIFNSYSQNLNENFNNLYSRIKKYKEGDILLIVIKENTMAYQTNETNLEKSANISSGINISNFFNSQGNIEFDNNNAGKGVAKQSGIINTYISVIIKKINENGNLIIEGIKEIEMNENKQKIIISGEINPVDIYSENYIDSSKIANLKISYTGDGILGNKVKPGIISQIFDWLRIF